MKMSGYRCVNYYELCRLCTASHGIKTHIFSDEGRKKDLPKKISVCLPVVINEQDKLPKILCAQCLIQVETIAKFRETCINAQTMLESCLNSSKLRNGGKVYIKDVAPKKSSTAAAASTSSQPVMTSMAPPLVKQTYPKTTATTSNSTPSDFLSNIIQAVGIQNMDEMNDPIPIQQTPQYTITLDGQTIKTNQIHYKIEAAKPIVSEHQQQQSQTFATPISYQSSSLANVDEFLKLKTNPQISATIKKREPMTQIKLETTQSSSNMRQQTISTTTSAITPTTPPSKKQKINLVITSPPQQTKSQQTSITPNASPLKTNQTTTAPTPSALVTPHKQHISFQDLKLISPNKCYLPITLKDGGNDQQIVAQIDTKNLVLPTAYLQMKLQPQITTVDGQHVVQLTNLSNSLSIGGAGGNQTQQLRLTNVQHPQQQQQLQLQQHQLTPNTGQMLPTLQSTATMPQTSETKTLFTTSTGQSVTITHQPLATLTSPMTHQSMQTHSLQQQHQSSIPTFPQSSTVETSVGKVQLTMLQNVPTTTMPQALPQKSGITIQRIKTEPITKTTPSTTTTTATTSTQQRTNYSASTIAAISNMASPPISINSATLPTTTHNKQTTATAKTIGNNKVKVHQQTAAKRTTIKTEPKTMQSPTKSTAASTNTTTATSAVTTTGADGGAKSEVPTCDVCEKIFKRKEHLAQHMKLHLGLRPFKCEEKDCNKAFSRKEHLMRHVVSHTGKKMFSCEFCQKLFSRKDNLNKHRRLHILSNDTAPVTNKTKNSGQYVCNICEKSFVVKMYYEQHKSMHKPEEINAVTENKLLFPPTTSENNKIKKKNVNKTIPKIETTLAMENTDTLLPSESIPKNLPIQYAFTSGISTPIKIESSSSICDSHDTAVMNLPSNFSNVVSLNVTQYNELLGQLKIQQQQQQHH